MYLHFAVDDNDFALCEGCLGWGAGAACLAVLALDGGARPGVHEAAVADEVEGPGDPLRCAAPTVTSHH